MANIDPHARVMHEAHLRFYAELNDFLPAGRRQRDFPYQFTGTPSVKDIVEAIGDHHEGTASPLALAVHNARNLAHALGYGDGLIEGHEVHEGEPDLNRDEKLLLSSVGGVESLHNRVDWFKNALTGKAAA